MLTALAVRHVPRRRLPAQRAQLCEQIMECRFVRLAQGMQAWKGRRLQICIDTATERLAPAGLSLHVFRSFLQQAQIDSGMVILRGGDKAHRSVYQQYGAIFELRFAISRADRDTER